MSSWHAQMEMGRKLSRMACQTAESMKVTSTEKELSTKTEIQKTTERERSEGLSDSLDWGVSRGSSRLGCQGSAQASGLWGGRAGVGVRVRVRMRVRLRSRVRATGRDALGTGVVEVFEDAMVSARDQAGDWVDDKKGEHRPIHALHA